MKLLMVDCDVRNDAVVVNALREGATYADRLLSVPEALQGSSDL